ncbi:hypothetical protein Bca4012_095045 [Brassica carinata]
MDLGYVDYEDHRDIPGSTANPCTTTAPTPGTATAATPSWALPQLRAPPLPQLLHRCYRNFFTAAAATPCTATPLSLHPATVTPCTTTATTLFTTTSIPFISHLLSPPTKGGKYIVKGHVMSLKGFQASCAKRLQR